MILMVLVPANTLYVIPGIRAMTEKTLGYSGMFNASHLLGYHFEMPHVVARWRLMTLRALRGCRGGMTEIR